LTYRIIRSATPRRRRSSTSLALPQQAVTNWSTSGGTPQKENGLRTIVQDGQEAEWPKATVCQSARSV
jgi:hypothetical protein